MKLPRLENWDRTVTGLHQGALIIGAVQRLTQDPQPAYLELALMLTPQGVASGNLPSGGKVILDFPLNGLVYQPSDGGQSVTFPLNGCTQSQVFNGLLGHLSNGELKEALPPGDNLFDRVVAGIEGRHGRYRRPERKDLLDETPIEIDPNTSRNYFFAMQEIFTGLARFKARLRGMQTPLVVWPHGLDLSTLWFVGTQIDESQPHMNFGFSPRSEGLVDPYLYAYASPISDPVEPSALPQGASWHTEGWKGVVLPYQVIAAKPDPVGFLEDACAAIYRGLRPLLPD